MDSGDKSDSSPQEDESLRTQLRPMAYHLKDPFSIVLIPFWRGHLNLCTPFLPCPFLKQKVTTSQPLPASFLLGASQKPPGCVFKIGASAKLPNNLPPSHFSAQWSFRAYPCSSGPYSERRAKR